MSSIIINSSDLSISVINGFIMPVDKVFFLALVSKISVSQSKYFVYSVWQE